MVTLLESVLLDIINNQRGGHLPEWNNPVTVGYEDIADRLFDIVDIKHYPGGSIRMPARFGVATYVNGNGASGNELRFIHYDDMLSQFRVDDRHDWVKGVGRADYIVYNYTGDKKYFVIHELSTGSIQNKRKDAIRQLFGTINLLFKSDAIRDYINEFPDKRCVMSADRNEVKSPLNMADGFMNIVSMIPDPEPLPAQSIVKKGFTPMITCNVVLP
jgi:hypothetical protein